MAWSTPAAACLLLVLTGCSETPTAHIPDDVDVHDVQASQQGPKAKRSDRLVIRTPAHFRVSNASASSRPRRRTGRDRAPGPPVTGVMKRLRGN